MIAEKNIRIPTPNTNDPSSRTTRGFCGVPETVVEAIQS